MSCFSIEVGEIVIPNELLKMEKQFHEMLTKYQNNKSDPVDLSLGTTEAATDTEHSSDIVKSLEHIFIQGPNVTLADLALLPCIALILVIPS